jgi:hypothetical protein
MRPTCARSEHQHVKAFANQTQRLEAPLAVVSSSVFDDQRTIPFKCRRQFGRDPAREDVPLVLRGVKANIHLFTAYAYIQYFKPARGNGRGQHWRYVAPTRIPAGVTLGTTNRAELNKSHLLKNLS